MRGCPWGFLAVIAALVAYGLVVCWSAVQGDADYNFTRQLQGVAVGLVAMVALWAFDYRLPFEPHHGAARHQRGAHPSAPHSGPRHRRGHGGEVLDQDRHAGAAGEFAKVTVVLFAASLLARYQGTLDDWREYCKVLGMLLVPFAAIMTQPDLGTGLVYLAISAVVLVMGGAKGRYLLITLIAGIAAIAAVFAVDELLKYQQSDGTWEYRLLKNYQRSRLLVFLNPEGDLSGDGYNLAQAKIAIGSGGLFGKASATPRSRPTAFCPRPPRTSSSAFWPRSSGSWASWRSRPVRPAHRGVPLPRPPRRQPLRHAHRHGGHRHVALPDFGEHRHGLRPYAYHGHSAALRQLRLLVHGRELRAHRAHRLGVLPYVHPVRLCPDSLSRKEGLMNLPLDIPALLKAAHRYRRGAQHASGGVGLHRRDGPR